MTSSLKDAHVATLLSIYDQEIAALDRAHADLLTLLTKHNALIMSLVNTRNSIADMHNFEQQIATKTIVGKPIAEQQIGDKPIAGKPTVDEHIADKPRGDGQIADESTVDKPIAGQPIAGQPIADQCKGDKPIGDSDGERFACNKQTKGDKQTKRDARTEIDPLSLIGYRQRRRRKVVLYACSWRDFIECDCTQAEKLRLAALAALGDQICPRLPSDDSAGRARIVDAESAIGHGSRIDADPETLLTGDDPVLTAGTAIGTVLAVDKVAVHKAGDSSEMPLEVTKDSSGTLGKRKASADNNSANKSIKQSSDATAGQRKVKEQVAQYKV